MLVVFVANMTLSVPDGLRERMGRFPQLKWSEVARKAFEREVSVMEAVENALSGSSLAEEDAERIGHKVKGEIRKRFK